MKKLSLTLALALVAGCDSPPLEPLPRDFYALESIAGIALPAPYGQNPNFNGVIVADSISFRDDGTGLRHVVVDDPGYERASVEQPIAYTRDGNTIAITINCPPLASSSCLAGPHQIGTIEGDVITINQSIVTRAPLVYRRTGVERLESRRAR